MLCQFFFSLKLTFQASKIHILESILFAKQELISRVRLRVKDFATGKNFSFNQCHNKGFAFFHRKLIYKSDRKLLPEFA